jgi:DME family drug/metabolite transporter
VLFLVTTPIWVAAFRWLGLKRAPTGIEAVAIVLVVVGVAIMVNPTQSSLDLLGVLGGLLSSIAFGLFVFILDQNRAVPPELGFPLGMIGAAALLLVSAPTASATILGDGDVIWLGVVVGVSAAAWSVCFAAGLRETDAVTAATVSAVEPVFVAVLAFLILGEQLSAREIVGGVVVLIGILTAALRAGERSRSASG